VPGEEQRVAIDAQTRLDLGLDLTYGRGHSAFTGEDSSSGWSIPSPGGQPASSARPGHVRADDDLAHEVVGQVHVAAEGRQVLRITEAQVRSFFCFAKGGVRKPITFVSLGRFQLDCRSAPNPP